MTRVTWTWRCLDPECPEKGAGEQADVQRAADRHTSKACHGTVASGVAR